MCFSIYVSMCNLRCPNLIYLSLLSVIYFAFFVMIIECYFQIDMQMRNILYLQHCL